MAEVKVNVLKIIDESFPIFVEFELIDYKKESHHFIGKLPYVCDDYDAVPPCVGYMRCRIIETKEASFVISTDLPDDIESTTGEYQFEVDKNQVKI